MLYQKTSLWEFDWIANHVAVQKPPVHVRQHGCVEVIILEATDGGCQLYRSVSTVVPLPLQTWRIHVPFIHSSAKPSRPWNRDSSS